MTRFFCTMFTSVVLSASLMAENEVTTFKINPSQEYQTMDYFSASDAWSMQFVGLWPDSVQQQVADWLFSTENDTNGQPKGIGLSLWRFNIGAGSAEQGRDSQIGSRWTRTECFLKPDGTYDWTKQKGQCNFLKLAKERGVKKFLAFFNSPPVYFTQNGLATNTGRGGTFNLKPECYDDFARFAADVIEGVEKHHGIKFDYLCPVNEPDGHWNWLGPKQEGTPATNREIARIVRAMSKEFVSRGIYTKLLVSESSDYRCMFRTHMTDWQRGYQIQSFFCPDSTETYLGDTPNVPHMMVGHSYWTNTPLSALKDIRCQLRDSLNKYNVDFWETETCIMGNDEEIGGGGGYDRTMKTALYVGRIIHHDIVYAGAKSWQWWRAIGGDYKDGLLREYSTRDGKNGYVVDSKLLWVMGNYSRFIRPGAIRTGIETYDRNEQPVAEGDTDQTGLMCTAYRNTDGHWVVVMLNYAETEADVRLAFNDKQQVKKWQPYLTADGDGINLKPLKPVRSGKTVTIPARSAVTFVSQK